jgi:dethiobiotin synthetase
MSATGYFITGTDTGVGKTVVACALLHALAAGGARVIGMKPVAAGARMRHGRLENEDVSALKAAANVSAPDELINPYCFEPPIAPHIAAAEARVHIELARLTNARAALAERADYVVIEGAGGFRVPLGGDLDTAQMAAHLGLPVLLVVGMRLGCINHALLTAAAINAVGLPLAGWVANHIDRHMIYAQENVTALEERLHAPLLARIPWTTGINSAKVAAALDTTALFS